MICRLTIAVITIKKLHLVVLDKRLDQFFTKHVDTMAKLPEIPEKICDWPKGIYLS